MVGGIAIAVLGISYFALGNGKEEPVDKTKPMEEVAIPKGQKEVASETHDKVVDERMTPRLLYQDIDILDSLADGSLIESFY